MSLNLLDLNDDCLLEIFKKLTVSELADIASTCTRFKTVARDAFSHCHHHRRHKSTWFKIDVECCTLPGLHEVGRRQAAAVLRNFGDLITRMRVNFLDEFDEAEGRLCNTFIFNVMSKYCTGELERLELGNCVSFQSDKIVDAAALFRNVQQLHLFNSAAINGIFLSDAKQLDLLRLSGLTSSDAKTILSNDFPQLQTLSLAADSEETEIDIVDFLKRHPNLVDLELRCGEFDLSSIGECRSLTKLYINKDCECGDYMPIAQLEHLTALKLSSRGQSLLKVLQTSKSSQSLEELMLFDLMSNAKEFITTVPPRFTNLTRLEFKSDGDFNDDLLADLHRWQKLRNLAIGGGHMSITTSGLINLVRQLPDLKGLVLVLDSSDNRIQLKESTYLRLCDIYRGRNKKLRIYNLDITRDGLVITTLFNGHNQQNFVVYMIGMDDEIKKPIVEI